MAERDRVEWSQLPRDILSLIEEKHLNTRIVNLRLRSVCRSWRSSIPPFNKPPPSLPLLIPSPILPNPLRNLNRGGSISLTESTIYLIQPLNQNPKPNTSIPWLVRVEEIENGKMRALNPFSQFLPEKMPETFPKQVNLLDFRITEIAKAYYTLPFIDRNKSPHSRSLTHMQPVTFNKTIVSSRPWSDSGAVMVIHRGKLRFFKLADNKWISIDCTNEYHDIAYHEGQRQFYAVGSGGRTVMIGSDLKAKPIASVGPNASLGNRCANGLVLMKSCGDDLFLIDKYELQTFRAGKQVYFQVLKLNDKKKKWERIQNLGDRVFFYFGSYSSSYSVSARDFTGLKGNCIYFTNSWYSIKQSEEWFADTGVFSLADCTRLLWPPPPWLKPTPFAMKK